MNMFKSVVLSAVAFPLSLFAVDYAIWHGANGVWQDDATWDTYRNGKGGQPLAPIDGEDIYLRPQDAGAGVTNTLSLSSDLSLAPRVIAWWCWQVGGSAGAYAFDGNGHTFLTPDFASDGLYNTGHENRFNIRSRDYSYFFDVQHSGKSANDGFMRLEDPHFTVFDHGKHFGMDIDRGVYDFYAPDGTPHGTSISCRIGGNGSGAGTEFDFTMRGQTTSLRAAAVLIDLVADTNRFTITDGATLEGTADGYLRLANVSQVAERWVTLSKGATLKAGTGYFGKSASRNGLMHVTMTDSTFAPQGTFSFNGDGEYLVSNSTIRAYGPKSATDPTNEYKGLAACENNTAVHTQSWHIVDSRLEGAGIRIGAVHHDSVGKVGVSNTMERVHVVMMNGMSWGAGYHHVTNLTRTIVNGGAFGCDLGAGAVAVFEDVDLTGRRLNVGNYSQQFSAATGTRLYVQHGTVKADLLALGLNYPAEVHVRDGGVIQVPDARLAGSNSDSATDQWRTNARDSLLALEKGGTLVANRLFGHNNAICRGGTAKATVVGDGGVLRPSKTLAAGTKFVQDLDAFEMTANGLTLDLGSYAVEWKQDVTDASGEAGRFAVRGTDAGSLSVADSVLSVAETVVESGSVRFGSGAVVSGALVPQSDATVQVLSGATLSGDLILTNGARIVLAAGATVNLRNLTVDDGILALDPSVTINVSGKVSLRQLQLEYTTPPTLDQPISSLVLGSLAEDAVIDSWLDAVLATPLSDGAYMRFSATRDAETGKTTFSATKKNESAPLPASADKVWEGTGAWSTGGNWRPSGAPTGESRAVFSSETASSSVLVTAGAEVGALEFNAEQGYSLVGDALRIAAEQGAAAVDVKKGAHEIAVPVKLSQRLDMTVADAAALTISEPITSGALKKSGKGALVLSGANDFRDGVSLSGGRNSVVGSGLVGSHAGVSANVVHLGNDTFELDETASANFASALSLEGENNDYPVVIKNDGDMSAKVVGSTGGSFLKHGAGELTLDFGAQSANWPAGAGGRVKNMTPQTASPLLKLPADGVIDSSMTNYLWSLTVASGALRLKGDSRNTRLTTPPSPAGYFVGAEFSDWSATPELIIDGLYFLGSGNLQLGYSAGSGGRSRTAKIQVLNGGVFQLPTIVVGNGCWSGGYCPELTVAVTNATFVNNSGSSLALPRPASQGTAFWRCKDSEICYRAPIIQGHIDAVYDHCVVNNWYEPDAYWKTTEFAYGTVEFCNGSVLYARELRMTWDGKATPTATAGLTFVWDDARLAHNYQPARTRGELSPDLWDEANGANPKDLVIDSSCCRTDLFSFEFRGQGMTVSTPATRTLTLGVPLKGNGGLTQYGAGTTVIKDGAWQFKGAMNLVGGGTLDVSQHGSPIADAKLAGSGTVIGGAFVDPTFVRRDEGDVLTLRDCALSGRIKVDLGANELASPRALFRIAGTTGPVAGRVLVRGADGERFSGDVVTVDGVVTLVSIFKPGLLTIIR